jgi:hypothetical protein
MAAAVFFLLTGTWMAELALIGWRPAALIGGTCWVITARLLGDQLHARRTRPDAAVALVALRRVTGARPVR